MARLFRFVGPMTVLLGVFVMAMPFISVARVGPEMLAELPDADGIDIVDESVGWSALFADDFAVARRSYPGLTKQQVLDFYRSASYQSNGVDRFTKACCGDYDAVFVTITSSDSGTVVAVLSPADSDIQLSWPFIAFFGSVVTAAGLALVFAGHSPRRPSDQDAGTTAHPRRDDRLRV